MDFFARNAKLFVLVALLAIFLPNIAFATTPELYYNNPMNQSGRSRLPDSDVDAQSGAFTYSYPLTLPPGRNGLTPNLSLSYNSQNQDNVNQIGYGWSLEGIPSISRLNKTGLERLYTDNYFSSSLSGELSTSTLTDGLHGTYGAKIESGDFLLYTYHNNDSWTVVDKKGTRYTFGATQNAKLVDDLHQTDHVVKWFVSEIRDTNDNFIRFQYHNVGSGNETYPEQIIYTGHGTVDGPIVVTFNRRNRYPDNGESRQYGFLMINAYLIDRISVSINGSEVKRYDLGYTAGDNSVRSLLQSVTETGFDESGATTVLPATTFTYSRSNVGWSANNLYHSGGYNSVDTWNRNGIGFVDMVGIDRGLRLADVNGDTYPDLVNQYGGIYINAPLSGGWPIEYSDPNIQAIENSYNRGRAWVDVNGDGLQDMVRGEYMSSQGIPSVNVLETRINTFSDTYNFNVTSTGMAPPQYLVRDLRDNGIRFGDLNGDGLVDFAWGDTWQIPTVYVNNGDNTGWTGNNTLFTQGSDRVFTGAGGSDAGVRILDLNSDGVDEYFGQSNGNFADCNGNGRPLTLQPYVDQNYNDNGLREIDINGDGLIDFVWRRGVCPMHVYLNHGARMGWVDDPSYVASISQITGELQFTDHLSRDPGTRFADLNGDGMIDLIRSGYFALTNTGSKPDLLIGIQSNTGASTTISYLSSSKYFDTANNLLNPKLPYIIQTVRDVTVNDGAGNIAHTSYTYEGGKISYPNPRDRKFAGFHIVTAREDNHRIVKKYYHQGDTTNSTLGEYSDTPQKIGRIYRTEIYNDTNQLQSVTVDRFDQIALAPNRTFVKKIQSTTLEYGASGAHRDTATTYTYSNTNGNLTEQQTLGEVRANNDGTYTDIGTDNFTYAYVYSTDPNGLIRSLLAHERVSNYQNVTVRWLYHLYDGNTNVGVTTVTVGNETRTRRLLDGSTMQVTNRVYNSYGLPTSVTDPNGNVTTYSYDSFNLYPTTITNALNQSTQYTYDYSLGKPKTVIDPNGAHTDTTYDGLDRVVAVRQSDPNNPAQTVLVKQVIYTDNVFPRSIREFNFLDSDTNSVESVSYIDSSNRVLQTRREALGADTYTIQNIVYDGFGRKVSDSLPYVGNGSGYTGSTAAPSSLVTNYQYDSLDRPTRITNNLGVTTNAYSLWTASTTDPLGRITAKVTDAYNRLIETRELNGSSLQRTRYTYDGNNSLMSIVDASGASRNFTYDYAGRRRRAQDLHYNSDAAYTLAQYLYDPANNLTQEITPNSNTVIYAYDQLNRVRTEQLSNGNTTATYTYDTCQNGIGRVCQVQDPNSTVTYAYDILGRKISETKILDNQSYITAYTYDRQGNVVTQTVNNRVTTYIYNNAGLVQSITEDNAPLVTAISYAPTQSISEIVFANGVRTVNTYDSNELYRLKNKVTTKPDNTFVQRLAYTYDTVGNIIDLVDSSITDAAKHAVYTYDDLYRLTRATITDTATGTSAYTQNFTYSPTGNILTSPQGTFQYLGHTIANSLANPNAPTTLNGSNCMLYDGAGNLTTDCKGTRYSWDYRNRLIQSATADSNTTTLFYYDNNNDRIYQTNRNSGSTTTYPNKYLEITPSSTVQRVYLGDMEVAEYTTTNTTTSTPTTTVRTFVHTDHLGSTNLVTDDTGNIVETLDYYPYGESRVDNRVGDTNDKRKYIGQFYDDTTGLTYLNARYYDAKRGQFISSDPASFKTPEKFLTDPQQFNFYSYGRGNPIRFSDPKGETVGDFVGGFLNAYLTNNVTMGFSGRVSSNDFSTRLGQTFGDSLSFVQGAAEMITGGGAMTGGSIACGSGAGCLVGAPAIATGYGLVAHGAGIASAGAVGLSGDFKSFVNARDGVSGDIPKPKVENSDLQNNFINKLFKDSDKYVGGTAEAARIEKNTGQSIGGKNHFQKASDYSKGLQNWIHKNQTSASTGDLNTATRVMNDLKQSIKK
ncbi:MAG: hypothetical protein KBD73_00600 [Candidatus Magasanikbacteria bacterium]|nr:hypothetical protein [Candidatus Magasanikbacteria bacterium]